MKKERVGLAFHESFALNLPSIRAILRLSNDYQGLINPKIIRENTSLGPNYVRSMPQYARACGLIDMKGYRLTPLGEVVYLNDPNFDNASTLWLMHYHMSTPQGPGPSFWTYLVTQGLHFGDEVSAKEVTELIRKFQTSQDDTISLKERTLRTAAAVFLGTYTKSDGLGRLGLIKKIPQRDGYVRISESQSPPIGVIALALADYWSAHFGEQVTVSLDELMRDDGFSRVMWMNYRQFNEVLTDLKRKNVVDLYRVAPPYQVARQWSEKKELLAGLYT